MMLTCIVVISGDMENQVEVEEKTRLINQVLELQHTLEGKKNKKNPLLTHKLNFTRREQ